MSRGALIYAEVPAAGRRHGRLWLDDVAEGWPGIETGSEMPQPQRLHRGVLQALRNDIARPTYARERLRPSIVHIGVGGFHRAHQAVYLDDIAEQGVSLDWGERGIGLLPHDRRMAEALLPQDCLYTVVERGADGDAARVIGALTDYVFAPDQPERALEMLASPETRIVTLTITEGGYLLDDTTGEFDAGHASILADLEAPDTPRSVFGYLCTALDRRRAAGTAPFTILSCDNLQGNGDAARRAVTAFARLRDTELAAWIEAEVAFPNSMVDRITPQTTDADRRIVAETFGIADAWPVVTEPFRQWILEDHFCNGRPPLDAVGVQLVPDVAPYETMKLRLLNGSHQALAYLGLLAGYQYVHEAMSDDMIRRFLTRLMEDEVAPLLSPVPGIVLAEYQSTLIERFSNPAIADTLLRLAADSSDRMPKFVLPSISEALEQGRSHRLLTLVVAAYIRCLQGTDDEGRTIMIDDHRAPELQRLALGGGTDTRPVLGMRNVFGDLRAREPWVPELSAVLEQLAEQGVRSTIWSLR